MHESLTPDILAAAAYIRGTLGSWEPSAEALDAIARHGVTALVYRRAKTSGGLPAATLRELERNYRTAVANEIIIKSETVAVLDALHAAAITPLILKGTALAWSLYDSPAERPRGDTDLLIDPKDRERTLAILASRGYDLPPATSGLEIMHQRAAYKRLPHGATIAFDIHWKISNRPRVCDLLTYPVLLSRAIPLPAFGPHALRLSDVDALLHALVHRVGHHREDERLIWLYDIHLLETRIGAEGVAQLRTIATQLGLWSASVDGLRAAAELFGSAHEHEVEKHDWSRALTHHGPPANHLFHDLRLTPGLARKLRVLREHAFPPASYMREKFNATGKALPLAYVTRAFRGLRKLLRRR